jgi:DNA-binding NtrC family response regulator
MDTPVELLVYTNDHSSVDSLVSMLEQAGHVVDVATDVASAQGLFLQRGGHALLVVTPAVCSGEARRLLDKLRAVDPGIVVVVFGDSTLRSLGPDQVHRIRSFFPGSRAGVGAIQKLLCSLSRAD